MPRAKSAPSTVISLRLPAASTERLKRMALRHGWTTSDTSARLVEEGLRRSEFALIDYRDSPVGRQTYIQGSTLAVWEVVQLIRDYSGDLAAVAAHLEWPETRVRAALNYADSFPEEIDTAIAEDESITLDDLKRLLPHIERFSARLED
jgi:uncharacterized protein (DUF433 family)